MPECTSETATGKGYRLVKEIYALEGSDEGSVPVLFDKKTQRIVNNESAEIIRMLNAQAKGLAGHLSNEDRPDLYPDDSALRDKIDSLNARIYRDINNGAYKAGFSSRQDVYATAFTSYFEALSALDEKLADGRHFLTGDKFTEADLRLFPTLYRHDPVYYVRMKLNGAEILDFPNLWRWLCPVYAIVGVAQSKSLVHCRQGYFDSDARKVFAAASCPPTNAEDVRPHSAAGEKDARPRGPRRLDKEANADAQAQGRAHRRAQCSLVAHVGVSFDAVRNQSVDRCRQLLLLQPHAGTSHQSKLYRRWCAREQ